MKGTSHMQEFHNETKKLVELSLKIAKRLKFAAQKTDLDETAKKLFVDATNATKSQTIALMQMDLHLETICEPTIFDQAEIQVGQ
jgi:hypothetical protein